MRQHDPRRVGDLRRLTTMTNVSNQTPIRVRVREGDETRTMAVTEAMYEPDGGEDPEAVTLWLTAEEADGS